MITASHVVVSKNKHELSKLIDINLHLAIAICFLGGFFVFIFVVVVVFFFERNERIYFIQLTICLSEVLSIMDYLVVPICYCCHGLTQINKKYLQLVTCVFYPKRLLSSVQCCSLWYSSMVVAKSKETYHLFKTLTLTND